MKRIPIKVAREIAERYDSTIVAIVAWDGKTGQQHVTTYGKNDQECQWAADLGNIIKRDVLRWPEERCRVQPTRKMSIPGYIEPDDDEEIRYCETCGNRIIVPKKSDTTECSKCLEF
jgi:hypothetical protein